MPQPRQPPPSGSAEFNGKLSGERSRAFEMVSQEMTAAVWCDMGY
jgi:hypothetical protein